MSLAALAPGLRPFVNALSDTSLAHFIKSQFSSWEVAHMVSMAILGGTSILLNLRLIGAGPINETPSEIERNLRLWINVGVVGILVTGLLMAMPDGKRVYNSAVFGAKMLALLAGLIFTYGVSRPVAQADGVVGRGPRIWWLVGMAVFLLALFTFVTTHQANPGLFHVMTAAALIVLFVTPGQTKWVYLAGLLLLVAMQTVGSHVVVHQGDFERLDPLNRAFAWVFAIWILGFAAYQLFVAKRGPGDRPLTQAIGYVSILVWVTAAAAGRWIAFG